MIFILLAFKMCVYFNLDCNIKIRNDEKSFRTLTEQSNQSENLITNQSENVLLLIMQG